MVADFGELSAVVARFKELGGRRILCKRLAENDNSKQQIYLGGSFEVLRLLPYRDIRSESGVARPNFKAAVNLRWIDAAGHVADAPGAQLILYPDYPEVRLSGFLRGCPNAPSALMQPVPRNLRRYNNGPDGRVLLLAVTPENAVLAYMAGAGTPVAREIVALDEAGKLGRFGVFLEVLPAGVRSSRDALLDKLRTISEAGWHESRRLNDKGVAIPYTAQNGGGYTLEALFGIRPNAEAAPDFMGWELKAYSSGRVTLMTPEPDTGYYATYGVEAFVRKYGHKRDEVTIYFTGTHRANEVCRASGQVLTVRGFDAARSKIIDVTGGIELVDSSRKVSAGWSFQDLISHWGRKHRSAAYVPYDRKKTVPPKYRYRSPVLLGEGTDFEKYLAAIVAGHVVYDPGSKVVTGEKACSKVKARSQFRIPVAKLAVLYHRFESIKL